MLTQNKFLPWIVCFSAALFFFYEFIQMNMFNAISHSLMRDFSIDATQLGKLSAIYFYANVLFLPVAGSLLDRFSTRRMILITMFLCAVGIGIFALSHSILLSSIARFMSGIGSAFCFLSSMRLASRWFPAQRMALVSGLIVTMAMIGGMVAQTPLTLLTGILGWRHALLLDSLLGFAIIGVVWVFVRDYPPGVVPSPHLQAELKSLGLLRSLRMSYLNIQNWLCALYTSLLDLPIALLGAIWGSLYLVQVEHLTPIQASYVTTMLFLGTVIGGPLLGWFSDRVGRRKIPMIITAILSLLILCIIMYVTHLSLTSYLILFFLLGFITAAQVISYPLVAESNPAILTATSVSVVSLACMGSFAVFQPIFGWLMDLKWHGQMIDNVRIYSAADYQRAFLIILVGFLVALACSFFLRETFCRRSD